jgi:hypothetical protein
MADDRQIKVASKVFIKEGNTLEEGDIKYISDTVTKGALGSKSINTDISEDQSDNNWYSNSTTFSGTCELSPSTDILKFCYIKNLSNITDISISINSVSSSTWNNTSTQWQANSNTYNPSYPIIVPPNGSVYVRGNGTIKRNAISVAADSGTIEYIIAK